jgi:spore coat protein U-like protein
MNLGTYMGTQSDTGVTTLTVHCNGSVPFTIGLNAGMGTGATTATRKMTGPSSVTLNYKLFQDSARTINWGNTANVDTKAGTGSQVISIYPRVLAGQLVAPGTYFDTISTFTQSFAVTAVVQATCTVSAAPLVFGTYIGSPLAGTSGVTVTCTNTTTWNIGLNAGTTIGATVTTRKMAGPAGAALPYGLFLDSGHTKNWGLTTGVDASTGTGSGAAQPISVYGLIAAGLVARPGSYSDTIIATVSY